MPEAVDLSDLEQGAGPPPREIPRSLLARTLAKWLLWLIGGVLVGVALYALSTYPHPSDFSSLRLDPGQTTGEVYVDQRRAWFGELKDLLQLTLVALLVPLLSSVIGYAFGRSVEDVRSDDSPTRA